jgi:hypothetical protein
MLSIYNCDLKLPKKYHLSFSIQGWEICFVYIRFELGIKVSFPTHNNISVETE